MLYKGQEVLTIQTDGTTLPGIVTEVFNQVGMPCKVFVIHPTRTRGEWYNVEHIIPNTKKENIYE